MIGIYVRALLLDVRLASGLSQKMATVLAGRLMISMDMRRSLSRVCGA
jgi:hypothetical protein